MAERLDEMAVKDDEGRKYIEVGEDLHVVWGDHMKVVPGVLVMNNRITTAVLGFNGRPALLYDVRAGAEFEAHYTLAVVKGKVSVDCVYVTVHSRQNGLYMNRAVCGLNKKLDKSYTDIVYEYATIWNKEIDRVDVDPLRESPSGILRLNEFKIGVAEVARIYRSADWSKFEQPETVVFFQGQGCSLGTAKIFAVYNVKLPDQPVFLEVSGTVLDERFVRYDEQALTGLVSNCPASQRR